MLTQRFFKKGKRRKAEEKDVREIGVSKLFRQTKFTLSNFFDVHVEKREKKKTEKRNDCFISNKS